MPDRKELQSFTNIELKEVLKKLNLPTAGNKAELLARVLASDPDARCLYGSREGIDEAAGETDDLSAESEVRQSSVYETEIPDPRDGATNYPSELELLRRERLQREIELMRRERGLPRVEMPRVNESEQPRKPVVNIKMVSELLGEYDGTSQDFAAWEAQVRCLANTYELSDALIKIMIGLRIKGKVLAWFHSKPELLTTTSTDILREIQTVYDHRPSKMDLRKQFEKRTWQHGETFQDYYQEKLIKANRVPIPEDELLDYVIDGISDIRMRDHARMQNYASIPDMLQALKKISVGKDSEARWKKTSTDRTEEQHKTAKAKAATSDTRQKEGRWLQPARARGKGLPSTTARTRFVLSMRGERSSTEGLHEKDQI